MMLHLQAPLLRVCPTRLAHIRSIGRPLPVLRAASEDPRALSDVGSSLEQQAEANLATASSPVAGRPTPADGSAPRPPGQGGLRTFEPETTPQHFGGALTTLIFGAALLSERLNGIGIVQNLELHNSGLHPLLLATIAGLLVAAAWPEARERRNPSGVVRLQMGVARIAYLGLAAAIAAEMFTGKGILTLLDFETGTEVLSDVEAGLAFIVMLILTGPQSKPSKK